MFKEMGQIANLMRNLPKMKEQMEEMQSKLEKIHADGDAGAGMVRVRANGKMELVSITISDDALKMQDKACLEELIRSASNQALAKAKLAIAEETAKMSQSLGLPGGFQIPGFS
ncbi:YbaB/EbfC family nucleoid-associated protein [bacterium]|jgi:DNA-binding YbaB/EbfC family protein|nr:YbaB/EbfC family nucleoid-associated protein [bacterium]